MAERQYVHGRGTQNYGLGSMGFLTLLDSRTLKSQDVDLAYVSVSPTLELREQSIREDGTVARDVPRLPAVFDFAAVPEPAMRFGFAGDVTPSLHGAFLISRRSVFAGLTYCGQVEENVYGFQLPAEHPGHDCMEGRSGAPILDERGRTVSLVLRGDEADDLVLGIDLRPYRAALDVELMGG